MYFTALSLNPSLATNVVADGAAGVTNTVPITKHYSAANTLRVKWNTAITNGIVRFAATVVRMTGAAP